MNSRKKYRLESNDTTKGFRQRGSHRLTHNRRVRKQFIWHSICAVTIHFILTLKTRRKRQIVIIKQEKLITNHVTCYHDHDRTNAYQKKRCTRREKHASASSFSWACEGKTLAIRDLPRNLCGRNLFQKRSRLLLIKERCDVKYLELTAVEPSLRA